MKTPKTKMKGKRVKAWALVENGKLGHYYALAYICFTKKQAELEADAKNTGYPKGYNHNFNVVPVIITYSL